MSTKHDLLTAEDVKGCYLNKDLVVLIESYIRENNLKKEEVRILDWGSGRGRTVAMLREQGYDAYGVEIDALPYNNGLPYFQDKYETPKKFLKLINESCSTPFPDQYFDIIFSEQVLEHIADLDKVSREVSRITKKGGRHLHHFPAKWHLIEQHLYMPCIHWLPKDKTRFCLIYFYTLLGIEPRWQQLDEVSRVNKAKKYFDYSKNNTYYREVLEIKHIFEKHLFIFSFKTRRDRLKLFPHSLTIYLEKK